jgi:hypothetical protein
MSRHLPRKPRYVVNHKVRVQSGSVTADGVVVDLHEEGARLEAPARLQVGDMVSFTISGTEVQARVAWCKAEAAGLSFAASIPPALVADLHRETEGWITL